MKIIGQIALNDSEKQDLILQKQDLAQNIVATFFCYMLFFCLFIFMPLRHSPSIYSAHGFVEPCLIALSIGIGLAVSFFSTTKTILEEDIAENIKYIAEITVLSKTKIVSHDSYTLKTDADIEGFSGLEKLKTTKPQFDSFQKGDTIRFEFLPKSKKVLRIFW